MADKPNKQNIIIALLSLCVMLLLALTALYLTGSGAGGASTGMFSEVLRDTGNKLSAVGLYGEAAELYKAYLESEPLDTKTRAKISFSLADMYLKNSDYKNALTWLYIVESLDGSFSNKDELNRKIVMCLEKLGKESAAEYALQARSQQGAKNTESEKAGVVVAEVAGEKITLNEINEVLEKMPDYSKQAFAGIEGKKEFVRRYVAEELLYRKGLKLNYDKSEEITRQTRDFVKGYVVNLVLEKDIKSRISIEDEDLENYFIANKGKYKKSEEAKISIIKTKAQADAKKALKKIKEGADFAAVVKEFTIEAVRKDKGGKVDFPIKRGQGVAGVTDDEKINDLVFSTKPGEVTDVIKADDYYFIIKVDEYTPEREPEFDEVKNLVRTDYYTLKFSTSYGEMVKDMMSTTDVRFYLDRVK